MLLPLIAQEGASLINYAIAPFVIPAIVAGSQLAAGIFRTAKADSERKKLLKKPLAKFSEVPELAASRARANEMAQRGFTAEENAAYDQDYARSQNTAYSRAMNTAPNMAGAINAGINYGNTAAINQRSVADAQLHRQNIRYADTFSNYLQDLNNRNIAEQLNMTKAAFGAIGEGKREGINDITGAPATFAAIYSAGMGADAGKKAGGAGAKNGLGLNPWEIPSKNATRNPLAATTDWLNTGGYK